MPDPRSSEDLGGWSFALSAYLMWGLAPLFWNLLGEVPVLQLTAHRVVWSLPLLIGLMVFWRKSSLRSLVAERRVIVVHLTAVMLLATNWLVFLYAIDTDQLVEASLGYFANPLLSVLLGVVVLRERLTTLVGATVALAAVGVGVLTWEAGRVPWIAVALASSFAVYGLVRKLSPLNSLDGLTLEVMWALPVAAGYLLWSVGNGSFSLGSGISPWIIWGVAMVTAVPLLFFAEGARRSPLWLVGILQYVAPTLQFLLGSVVYGETVGQTRLFGFSLIWLALAIFAAATVKTARTAQQRFS